MLKVSFVLKGENYDTIHVIVQGEKVEYNYSFKLGTQKFDFHSTVLYKEVVVSEPNLDIETCVEIVPEVKN